MRTRHCCIDASTVESRCDQQLNRYLVARDATLFLGDDVGSITANVIVTGIDCDHFGPLLRAGEVVEADVEISDGCYRLVDSSRREHADDRARIQQKAVKASLAQIAGARALALAVIGRAQRA